MVAKKSAFILILMSFSQCFLPGSAFGGSKIKKAATSVMAGVGVEACGVELGESTAVAVPQNVGSTANTQGSQKKPRMTWSDQTFHIAMTALAEAYRKDSKNFRINVKLIDTNGSPEATEALQNALGPDVTTRALAKLIKRAGGTWDAALKWYGIDPAHVRQREEAAPWSTKKITNLLWALYEAGFSLNYDSVHKNNSEEFGNIAERILGKRIIGESLISAIRKRYPYYSNAIRVAKLPYGVLISLEEYTDKQLSLMYPPVRKGKSGLSEQESWRSSLRGVLSESGIDALVKLRDDRKIDLPEKFIVGILIPYIRFWQRILSERNSEDETILIASGQIELILREQGAQIFLLTPNMIAMLERTFRVTEISTQELRRRFLEGRMVIIPALKQIELNEDRKSGQKERFFFAGLGAAVLRDANLFHETLYRMMSYF